MLSYIVLIVGFILLAKGADYFIEGSSNIAEYFRVSPLFIGLTLAAFGTSAPEAAVSIKATIVGVNGIALGNVIGSNIANICLAIGIAALMKPLFFHDTTVQKELPFLLISSLVVLFFCFDFTNPQNKIATISHLEGIILLLLLIAFLIYLYKMAITDRKTNNQQKKVKEISLAKNIALTILGGGAIILGGHFTVIYASKIARMWGISEKVIGISVVAFGTSIPEIVTSIVAVSKNKISLAIGNIVGSNLFNILFVLGLASTIKPITLPSDVTYDAAICLFITLLFFGFSKMKKNISKIQGVLLLVLYICYVIFLFAS